jgi:ABC-type Na+ efflux pump permease subunit
MSDTGGKLAESIRISLAIAAKDITDAINNKTILSLLLALVFTMLTAQALPLVLKLADVSQVIVFDAGDSRLVTELDKSERYRLIQADSQQQMEETLSILSGKVLGLAVPAEFDEVLDAGGQPRLEGYVVWANRSGAADLKSDAERHLQDLLGQPVLIQVEGNVLYPPPEGGGRLGMVATVMVLIPMVIGAFLVPYLMFEEKQAHTIEVLLISPARISQIVSGKALAALFYIVAAMAVVFLFNYSTIAHWGIAILAAICSGILFIGVGLVLGSVFDSPQGMGLWVVLPFLLLLLSAVVDTIGASVPELLAATFQWLPTVALAKVFLLSFSGEATLTRALPDLMLTLAWAAPLYLVLIWLLGRMNR